MRIWLVVLVADVLVLSLITFMQYAWDKRQAGRGGWRISENQLHLLALMGGWPGALIGQRVLRHKSVKTRFRVVFVLTVMGHLALAAGITYLVMTGTR